MLFWKFLRLKILVSAPMFLVPCDTTLGKKLIIQKYIFRQNVLKPENYNNKIHLNFDDWSINLKFQHDLHEVTNLKA